MAERVIMGLDGKVVARVNEKPVGNGNQNQRTTQVLRNGEPAFIITETNLSEGRVLTEATDPRTGYTTSHIG